MNEEAVVSMDRTDVVIVGAGPFGLSLAAQLRHRGVSFRIFGQPMRFWRDMPSGINLKSLGFATSIYVPEAGHTLPDWSVERGLEDYEPISMQQFATYGMWMQERFVPMLEKENVAEVAPAGDGFCVSLESGRQVMARRVVCATGLSGLAQKPAVLAHLPEELAPHTSTISGYAQFADLDVAVIGGGASAIEAGALVREAGGRASVVVRGGKPLFYGRDPRVRPLLDSIKRPMTVLGPNLRYWPLQHIPAAFHFLPEAQRIYLMNRLARPSSPWWITDRVIGKVPLHLHSEVVSAVEEGGRVRITVRSEDGERQEVVDRVIAGTGYRFDVDRVPYLTPELTRRIARTLQAPKLSVRFESSVKGLYFIGPMSAMSFGPIFRFVCGANYASRALARHLGGALWARRNRQKQTPAWNPVPERRS